MPSTGVASPKTETVTNAALASKLTAWLRNWMALFRAPPRTLMFPTAVQADTSLGSVVISTVSELAIGPVVLAQAPSITTSARTALTENARVEVSRSGLDADISLLSWCCRQSRRFVDRQRHVTRRAVAQHQGIRVAGCELVRNAARDAWNSPLRICHDANAAARWA